MNKAALTKAKSKLDQMSRCLERFRTATQAPDIVDGWTEFVQAAGTFYNTLEQGVKQNGASSAWFGRKKRERKTDPLLSYIHHARNAEEHGIKPIAEQGSSAASFSPVGPSSKYKTKNRANGPSRAWAGILSSQTTVRS